MSVYPVSEPLAVSPLVRLDPAPLREPRFVLDVHLGRLARILRLLGFDCVWRNDITDEELAAISVAEQRILLTRDRGLLKRAEVAHGYLVRESDRRRQTIEVLRRFDLFWAISPFGRCLECNGVLEPVAREDVEQRLPVRTRRDFDDFRRCPRCDRIYWKGSHYDRLAALVEGVTPCWNGGVAVRSGTSQVRTPRARAALDAVARGWSVVPMHTATAGFCSCGDPSCPAPGKHTHGPWKKRMLVAAGIDQIQRWWRRWPDANVGIVTGAVSGLVVLDVDPRKGGGDLLAALEDVHGALPRTVESLTRGRRSSTSIFAIPERASHLGSIASGLDIKGDGGLVVSPPSGHVSGRVYVWESGCAPSDLPLADLPGWLQAMAQDPPPPPRQSAQDHMRCPARTKGERAEFAALWALVGVELRAGDHNYLCPFHADHHPSLHIDADGCRFYCFGCGRGGGSGRLRRLADAPLRPTPTHDEAANLLLCSRRPRSPFRAPPRSASWGHPPTRTFFSSSPAVDATMAACGWIRLPGSSPSRATPAIPKPSP